MSYPENISYAEDSDTWTETETVTYYSKTTEAIPDQGFELRRTCWTTIDRNEMKADSELSKFEFRVQIAGKFFPVGNVPKVGDLMLRTNNTRWIINRLEGPDVLDYDAYVTQDFSYAQGLNT